jgi:hypothetical protein
MADYLEFNPNRPAHPDSPEGDLDIVTAQPGKAKAALMGRLREPPSPPSVSWHLLLGVTRSRGVAPVMPRGAGHAA